MGPPCVGSLAGGVPTLGLGDLATTLLASTLQPVAGVVRCVGGRHGVPPWTSVGRGVGTAGRAAIHALPDGHLVALVGRQVVVPPCKIVR